MTLAQKPVMHARDHEHGGADPVRFTVEDVGDDSGGGGGGAMDYGTPNAIFTGSSLSSGLCVWSPSPWEAYSPNGQVAHVDPTDSTNRTLKVQQGYYLATFFLNSNANFALKQTGDATMSDYLQVSPSGNVTQPVGVQAAATWAGSNDGFNRFVGLVNFSFPLQSSFGHDLLTMQVDYLRAAGAITPTFSLTLVRLDP